MFNGHLNDILLIVFGYGSGVFVGTVSGTAESLIIPCLTIFMSYSMHNAIGTSLVVDCVIGGVAGLIFFRNNNVDLRSSFFLLMASVLAAFVASRFTHRVSETGLTVVIGVGLVILGLNFMINGIQKNVDYINKKINFDFFRRHKTSSFVFIGLIVGVFSGFLGMGSGGMVATVLVLVLGYDLHTAIGTSLLTMFFIAGAGAVGHAVNGEIITGVLPLVGVSAVVGAASGSLIANNINEDKLGRSVGVIVFLLGVFMVTKIFL